MPTDFESLKKLEGLTAMRRLQPGNSLGRLLVLVKLRKGAQKPVYLERRSEFGPDIFSAEISEQQLPALEADPAVLSVSISRSLSGID
jgi:hypothetical protein